ncbi:hypothetical protein [uncultured Rhodospira sp.]|uniref:hypothetical protein n=1 Tax=uncultured Rhodospira sp. TaxID=1936189 RepID=UPI0026318DBB|nr:hypothetical protein [uncultured Rhodospira sp.]
MTRRLGTAAIFGVAIAAFSMTSTIPALAGSGQEVTGPSSGCQGKNCPDQAGGGGKTAGPATDTTGGNEGSFADFER